jgi:hypothetical protein
MIKFHLMDGRFWPVAVMRLSAFVYTEAGIGMSRAELTGARMIISAVAVNSSRDSYETLA